MLAFWWVSPLHGADEPPAGTPSPEEQYEQIDREYEGKITGFQERYEKAATEEDRHRIASEPFPDRTAPVAQCLALARRFPHTAGAVRALIFVVHGFRDDAATRAAVDLLRAEYLDREELSVPCAWYGNSKLTAIESLVRDLATKSPHRTVRGVATLSLARQAARENSPDAEKLLEQVAADYGDVRVDYGSALAQVRMVREIADGTLLRLHGIAVGKVAPEIEGTDTDGAAMKLSDYRGKVVLLDFWGYW